MRQTDYEDTEYEEPKKHHAGRIILIILLVVAAFGLIGYILFSTVKAKVVSAVSDQVVERTAESLGVPSEEVQDIVDSVSPEDKATVNKIVSNHMNPETVDKAKQYVEDRDVDGAKTYAKEQLTPEEYSQIEEIAKKYVSKDRLEQLEQ